MRRFEAFVLASLLATAVSIALGLWLSFELRAPSVLGVALFVSSQVVVALGVAGAKERKHRPLAWVTCGMVASVLTGLIVALVGAPLFVGGLFALEDGEPAFMYVFGGLGLLLSAILIPFALRLAWPPTSSEVER